MTTLPFDTVIITEGSGSTRLSVEGFLALPLARRIGLILGRRLEFLCGGSQIDRALGLKSLMDQARQVPLLST